MRQPARADERRLRADNNGKRREQAADESGRRGKKGIVEVNDATRVGSRRQRQLADTDERTT
jgi:hypothetical protein